MNKTLLDMKLLLGYYKNNNILDRYTSGIGFGDGRLILDNDVMNVLDNIEEKIFIEPLNKKIKKDKEIEKLNNDIKELLKENEKLRMRNDMLRKDIDSFIQDNKIDYKSRIDKAVKYIKKHIQKYDIDGSIGDFDEFDILIRPSDLLDMLQNGGDKDE